MTDLDKEDLINRVLELQHQFLHVMRDKAEPAPWLGLNLTIAQLKSMIFIHAEGSTNFKNLAGAMGVTPPDITRIIDRLVEQDLVSREENPDNRRMQILKVTGQGEDLLKKLREHRPRHVTGILKRMSMEDLLFLEKGLSALLRAAEGGKRLSRE
jgi:DNA-binding MarR family transcriptional regulator